MKPKQIFCLVTLLSLLGPFFGSQARAQDMMEMDAWLQNGGSGHISPGDGEGATDAAISIGLFALCLAPWTWAARIGLALTLHDCVGPTSSPLPDPPDPDTYTTGTPLSDRTVGGIFDKYEETGGTETITLSDGTNIVIVVPPRPAK